MAYPVADSYSGSGAIAGGRSRLPLWRRGLPVRTWVNGIGANTINDINPRYDPVANPLYPAKPPWEYDTQGNTTGGIATVMDAWCGGAFGEATGNYWVFGGGHSDYGGNEVFVLDVYSDTPTWVRINNPTIDMAVSPTHYMLHNDGQTRTVHSYNNLHEINGELFCTGGSLYDQGGGACYVAKISRDDPVWKPDYLNSGTPYFGNSWGVSAYNAADNSIYKSPSGGNDQCYRYDIAAKTMTKMFDFPNNMGTGYYSAHWNPVRNVMIIIAYGLWVYDPSRNASFGWMIQQPPPVGGLGTGMLVGKYGVCYDSKRDVYYIWSGGDDHGSVWVLTPPAVGADPLTAEWTTSLMTNTGTPPTFSIFDADRTNAAMRGTYGRLFYSEKLDAIGVTSRVTDKLSILPLS